MTSETDVRKAVDFTSKAVEGPASNLNQFTSPNTDIDGINNAKQNLHGQKWEDIKRDAMSAEEAKVMKMVKNVLTDYFQADSYAGKVARLENGNLTLVNAPVKEGIMNGMNGHAAEPMVNGHATPVAASV